MSKPARSTSQAETPSAGTSACDGVPQVRASFPWQLAVIIDTKRKEGILRHIHLCLLHPYPRPKFTPVILVPAIECQNALASMSFAFLSSRMSLLPCQTGGPTSAAVPTETVSVSVCHLQPAGRGVLMNCLHPPCRCMLHAMGYPAIVPCTHACSALIQYYRYTLLAEVSYP